MKVFQIASGAVMSASGIALIVWHFLPPFSDWLVRCCGVIMLAALFLTVFGAVVGGR